MGKILKFGTLATLAGSSVYYLNNNYWDIKNIGLIRFGRAVSTVATIAADYKLSLRNYKDNSQESLEKWSQVHSRSAERLLDLCCTNGGVFIKVGQHIAAMEYMVPQEYVNVLKVLHNSAPLSDLNQIKEVIREDLGKDPDEIFEMFDEQPIGAASLAQVHKAKLKDGTIVAVKVQHRNVKRHSFIDMTTMEFLVDAVDHLFPEFSFRFLAEETKKNLPLELDFINEGKNAERIARSFSKFSWLKIPKVYWNLSNDRVLTMEYVDGGEVTDKQYMINNGINCREVSHRLSLLYSEMIFLQGNVHSDPHPGNILVKKNDKNEPEIILLDHGLYAQLTEDFRHRYSRMWLAVLSANVDEMKRWASELGVGNLYPFLASIMTHKPWQRILKGIDKKTDKATAEQDQKDLKRYVVQYFPQITEVLNRIDRQILLIFKTNDLLMNIDYALGTYGQRQSLITMSRCCIRAVHEEQMKVCNNFVCKLRANLSRQWLETKLTIYQIFLWLSVLVWGPEYW